MSARDDKGRFQRGNEEARQGGRARAAKLSPARRKEISLLGFRALLAQRFAGDMERCKDWLTKVGLWGMEQPYVGTSLQKFDKPEMEF